MIMLIPVEEKHIKTKLSCRDLRGDCSGGSVLCWWKRREHCSDHLGSAPRLAFYTRHPRGDSRPGVHSSPSPMAASVTSTSQGHPLHLSSPQPGPSPCGLISRFPIGNCWCSVSSLPSSGDCIPLASVAGLGVRVWSR